MSITADEIKNKLHSSGDDLVFFVNGKKVIGEINNYMCFTTCFKHFASDFSPGLKLLANTVKHVFSIINSVQITEKNAEPETTLLTYLRRSCILFDPLLC